MKKYVIALLLFPLLAGCGSSHSSNDKGTDNTDTKEESTFSQLSNAAKAVKSLGNAGDDIEKLQKMTPLTNDQLKAWLPEEVSGMKRISYSAGDGSMMKISSITATFANADKSKKLEISVVDGAGKTGSAMISLVRMELSQDFDREDQDKIEKTVKHDGNKAILTYDKKSKTTEIQFLENSRFSITATGTNMTADEVWDAIDKLDPDKLG